jgi:hypothetical protein
MPKEDIKGKCLKVTQTIDHLAIDKNKFRNTIAKPSQSKKLL